MIERNDDQDPAALDVVRRFIMGFRRTQLVHVAAKLGIADLLEDGAKDASTLAAITGAHPRVLYRVLLKSVLHNWDDAACLAILRHCRNVAHRGSRC